MTTDRSASLPATSTTDASEGRGDGPTITELDRIDVLAMVLQGRDGDHPSEFWRSRAHRLLNHREPLLAILGLVECAGAETCLTHVDGVLLETGSGSCDMSNNDEECRGAPLYRAQIGDAGAQRSDGTGRA